MRRLGRNCPCGVCRMCREVRAIQRKLPKRQQQVLTDLVNQWEAASTDATYYRMRLKGTWPT